MRELDGRVALVTGASRGIGKAIARRLGMAGAVVVAGAREEHARPIADEIVASGGTSKAVALDVTDTASVTAAVGLALNQFKRIDILVNNAGIVQDQLMVRMKPEEWEEVLATNLTGTFCCTQAVLRPMLKQRWGRVINISSVVGQSGNPGQANYSASKAGLIGLTKSLALEVSSRGITVNAVAPGLIATDMTGDLDESTQETLAKKIPLGRLGVPEDVAGVVWFLASDEASYITGQVVGVNGGMYM